MRWGKILFWSVKVIFILFFSFFLLLAAGFFAVRFGWTDVAGEEDSNSQLYNKLAAEINQQKTIATTSAIANLPESPSIYGPHEYENWCHLSLTTQANPYHGKIIRDTYESTLSDTLLDNMLLAFRLRLQDPAFDQAYKDCQFSKTPYGQDPGLLISQNASSTNIFSWQNGETWQIIEEALKKDKDIIKQVSEQTGVQSRLLVSVAIVEQLRLFYTQRELVEKVFKPLKILANANKMAWGIMAIKEKTAIKVEENLKDKKSPFYIGTSTENLLDYETSADVAKERYARLTNEKDHYYSYLYGALIIRQIENQWEKAGHPISFRPEIVATIFNIGFTNSKPKADPKVGGSTIEIDGQKYFFGSLAHEFYYSGVMADVFLYE